MATVIRLARFGKRHNPIYRAVVIDSRKARDDSFIEQVGFYNPNSKTPEIKFEQEKVLKWLQTGAQPSDTVRSLLKKVGIMDLFHEIRAGRSIEGKTATPRAERPRRPSSVLRLSPRSKLKRPLRKPPLLKPLPPQKLLQKHPLPKHNFRLKRNLVPKSTGLFYLAKPLEPR